MGRLLQLRCSSRLSASRNGEQSSVCNLPVSFTLVAFEDFDLGNIASLEPPTHPQNAAGCVDMENHAVLGGYIPEDVRVNE